MASPGKNALPCALILDFNMFEWTDTAKLPIVILVATTFAFSLSFPAYTSQGLKWLLARKKITGDNLEIRSWILAKALGGALLAIASLSVAVGWLHLPPAAIGLNFNHFGLSLLFAGIAWAVVAVGLAFFAHTCPWLFAGYPSIAVRNWNRHLLLLNAIGWGVYLFGFELLLRGLLLFPLAHIYGNWVAVAIAGSVYSMTQIAEQRQPVVQFVTIFAGAGFSLLALWTGSMLGPYLIHIFVAPAFEFFAIRAQPQSFTLRKQGDPNGDAKICAQ